MICLYHNDLTNTPILKNLDQRIKGFLDKRKEKGNLRSLTIEHELVDFCSNDYLGFAKSKTLESAIQLAVSECALPTIGATGSRLISGNFSITEQVEQAIANYHQAESALLFNSGYNANVGFYSCVPREQDTILYDELVHASIHDGMRLSKAKKQPFSHNNLEDLQEKIEQAEGEIFIAMESIYSMDGDAAPIEQMVTMVKDKTNVHLVIDEAHGTGIIGTKGEGLVSALGLEKYFFARIHTYGKAHGLHGASILGSNLLRKYLINFSRPFIYSTAMPLHNVLGIGVSYKHLASNTAMIEQLRKNIVLFRELLKKTDLASLLIPSNSAVQSLVIPGNQEARTLSTNALENGYLVKAILSPTVPKGKERLRICLHAYNTGEQIKGLVDSLVKS